MRYSVIGVAQVYTEIGDLSRARKVVSKVLDLGYSIEALRRHTILEPLLQKNIPTIEDAH